MQIVLYEPRIDYLTLTTYSEESSEFLYGLALTACNADSRQGKHERREMAKINQYEGMRVSAEEGGTIFWGEGSQAGKRHWLIKASGSVSSSFAPAAMGEVRAGRSRVRRIDVQITIEQPDKWSQWELLTAVKRRGRSTGWIESRGGSNQLATVYIGAWKSERLIRVYQKETEGGALLLRLEAQYKGDRSEAVGKYLLREGMTRSGLAPLLLYELQHTMKSARAEAVFGQHLGEKAARVAVVKSKDSKTRDWLLKSVLPAFRRVVNDHDADGKVAAAFLDAITGRGVL